MTGAQAIIQCLLEQGVDTVFGYPGGAVIPLYDALYDAPIRHILTVHEQGAIHGADGYARAGGKTGVCIVTSGPGAANIITGLATAYMDSVPLVAITGQVHTAQIGRDSFQEVDIISVSMAVTKHNFSVLDVKKLPEILRMAFAIARSGRPGPVLVDIPSNIQTAELDFIGIDCSPSLHDINGPEVMEGPNLEKGKTIINQAKRPILMLGGGVIGGDAATQVRQLAQKCHLPVVTTLMGLGSFPASHPQFLGITGMHGHVAANNAVNEADVIIAIGSRFSDRVTGDRGQYASAKTVIHVDVDPSEINKNIPSQLSLVGNIKQIISELTLQAEKQNYAAWWERIHGWQSKFKPNYQVKDLTAPWVMHAINQENISQQMVFVTDVGQNQMWAAQHLKIETPRSWITSGGFGTMGFGLPAAIGVQLAQPQRRVIHIAGDGGFKMTGMELYTIAMQRLPIISIILDNQGLGMVRQWQHLFYQGRYSSTQLPPFDFVGFARSCGVEAVVVDSQEQFQQTFHQALKENNPKVIVVQIPADHLVTPMIAPGATLHDYVRV